MGGDEPGELRGVVYLALEAVHAVHARHLGITTGADGGDEAVEAAIRGVIDDPPAAVVLGRPVDLEVEARLAVEAVELPQVADLAEDLGLVGVVTLPANGRVETVHCRVQLEAG